MIDQNGPTDRTPDAGPPAVTESYDWDAVREQLNRSSGPEYWRSIEELAGDEKFQEMLHREFPELASEWPGDVSRRHFLQLMSASLALAGLTACTAQPPEKIVPYVRQPEEIVPGKPLFFASSTTLDGYASGVLVESHMGRPTKIEGNPEHPASLGATDLFAQASILGLYDPDRAQTVQHFGRIRTWPACFSELQETLAGLEAQGGARLRILTETVTSPSLAATIGRVIEKYPQTEWHQYSSICRDTVRAGSETAYGRVVETRYDLTKAKIIVALDSDFLITGPGAVRYARDFAEGRRLRKDRPAEMSRFYAVESTISGTGSSADHRLASTPAGIESFIAALAAELAVPGAEAPAELAENTRRWATAVAKDLRDHRGAGLLVVGDGCSAEVHALAHAINTGLDNVGSTVIHTEPVESEPADQMKSLRALVDAMNASEVDVLLILGGNPVYDAPADLDFAEALLKVPQRYRLGLYEDETSPYCQWQLPQAHDLESWGDARSFDGTVTLQQPLIEPLYDGKTSIELVSALVDETPHLADELLREHWQKELGDDDFDSSWRRSLHDGQIADTALEPVSGELQPDGIAQALAEISTRAATAGDKPQLVFRPDPTVYDGRFANIGWLQECPKPLSKLTWDNAAIVAPAFAERQALANEDVVRLQVDGRTVDAPVWIQPGQPDNVVTVYLGYGRERAGRVGSNCGFNANLLRTTSAAWMASDLQIEKTGGRYQLASTQMHDNIEVETREAGKRHLVRTGTLAEYRHDPHFVDHGAHDDGENKSLYPDFEYDGYAWGLAVDLSACTACNACVIACQSENSIPIVGKDQVAKGREMHWIRIDRYFQGDLENPQVHHQPVMCMHCEQAPCEVVCPVAATTHSDEGLNDMVYNRCVGTRYCSNNCPYKVRRFNFLKYNDTETPVLKMMRNPDVTVRSRGVMEKCTYCVQRINHARIESEKDSRKVRDGEIKTACQQVCPSEAIVFGDINDPDSEVSRWKAEPTNYGILEELSTRPRTSYLARVRNPNPHLEGTEA